RYSRPSPLHRRGLQHPQTPLRARLSEPRAIRGSTRPATCQNRRLKLSTIKGALQRAARLAHQRAHIDAFELPPATCARNRRTGEVRFTAPGGKEGVDHLPHGRGRARARARRGRDGRVCERVVVKAIFEVIDDGEQPVALGDVVAIAVSTVVSTIMVSTTVES